MMRSSKLLIVICLFLMAAVITGCQDEIDKNIELLKSGNDAECAFAAERLGESGDKKTLKPLLAVIRDKKKLICRQKAADAAIEIGPESAAQTLFAVVSSSDRRAWGYMMAFDALEKIGEKATDMLMEELATGNVKSRKEAAVLLGKIGVKRAVNLLSKIVSEESESKPLRKAAILALGKIRDKGAAGPVIEALTDSRETLSIRAAALDSISLIDPLKAEPLLFKLMIDGEENVVLRNRAAVWIAEMPNKEALIPLVEILKSETAGWDRQIIAIGLSRFLKDSAIGTPVSTRFIGETQQINLFQSAFINRLGRERVAEGQEAELVVSFSDNEVGGNVGIKLTHRKRGVLMDVQVTTVAKPIGIEASNESKILAYMDSSYFKYLGDIVTIKLAGKQGNLDDKAIFLILSATKKK